jgi:hypothetical protein
MSDINGDELLDYVQSRLYDDDDGDNGERLSKWYATVPPKVRAYWSAKRSARDGNPEPLRAILTDLTGDPDIASFIAQPVQPRQPPRHTRTRKDYEYLRPFKQLGREHRVEMMESVRKILIEERGYKAYGLNPKIAEITAKILLGNAKPDDPDEAIKKKDREHDLIDELLYILGRGKTSPR